MSCICQYLVLGKDQLEVEASTDIVKYEVDTENPVIPKNPESNDAEFPMDICASDLVAVRAENWLLNKNLTEARISIENLETLMMTIVNKQNALLTELYHLKRANEDLEEECRLQRDYHTMERNALMRELQDTKILLQKHVHLSQETAQQNYDDNENDDDDDDDDDDNNGKTYLMGKKYLRLDDEHSCHSTEQSDFNTSSVGDQSE